VWLEDGKVKFGHFVAASSSWTVDKEIDYNGITAADTLDGYHAESFELAFGKNTAFNKDFAGTGSAITPARSDHTHGGTFSGDADTLDSYHASSFVLSDSDTWHTVSTYGSKWEASPGSYYVKKAGWVMLYGQIAQVSNTVGDYYLFILPEGYRPSQDINAGAILAAFVNEHHLCGTCNVNWPSYHGVCNIGTDGKIRTTTSIPMGNGDYLKFNAAFPII